MRDAFLFITVLALIPFIIRRAWIGVLVWSWIGYMNPHRLTWGFAYDFPFAQLVGIATLAGLLIDRSKKRFPITPLTVFWLLFIFWMNITTFFSLNPDSAWQEWDRTMKIQLFSIITVLLISNEYKIKHLVLVIAASIAFFGVKGGIFSVLTGGNYRVWGPPGSFIEGNNELGLALTMTAPLIWFLYSRTDRKLFKFSILCSFGLIAIAILTTHSRGALLTIAAMAMFLWYKSAQKVWLGLILVFAAPILWFSMPQHWHDRMATITEYQQDESAMGRINAWYFAANLANDHPLVGGGFGTFTPELFQRYAPNPEDFHDSHSIFFEVLAEQGYVGLLLYLGLGVSAFFSAGKVSSLGRRRSDLIWAAELGAMIQVSIVAYAVGGLFLGLAYFDLYYHLVAIIVVLRMVVSDEPKQPVHREIAAD